MSERLAQNTAMGVVDLLVRDLDAMIAYYHQGVGLDVLDHTGPHATLGRAARNGAPAVEIMRLTQNRDLPAFNRQGAGLYHTAILFGSQHDLAQSVLSVARAYPRSFTGSSDHHVSEAFYFDDLEGNGVELYFDRPRGSWKRLDDGTVHMTTLYLDPNEFLSTHLPADGSGDAKDSVAEIGHVHLQVGDIPTAEFFYSGVLGFDVMNRYGGQALFVAAGGYHHHIGMNTWHSRGAGPRASTLGLGQVSIELPNTDDVDALGARLRHHEVPFAHDGKTLRVDDPWGTLIEVRATVG